MPPDGVFILLYYYTGNNICQKHHFRESGNPQLSAYYRCMEDCFETFVRIYEDHFPRRYMFWRPYVQQ